MRRFQRHLTVSIVLRQRRRRQAPYPAQAKRAYLTVRPPQPLPPPRPPCAPIFHPTKSQKPRAPRRPRPAPPRRRPPPFPAATGDQPPALIASTPCLPGRGRSRRLDRRRPGPGPSATSDPAASRDSSSSESDPRHRDGTRRLRSPEGIRGI